jgi:hypothetical protein
MKSSLLVLTVALSLIGCVPGGTAPLSSSPLSTRPPTEPSSGVTGQSTRPARPVQPVQPAGWVSLMPVSYTITPGDDATDSSLRYIDESGRSLIDGFRGQNVYNANVSGVPSSEWVGWLNKDPVLTFRFAQTKRIQRVTIGFSHTEYAGIALPKNVVINGKAFALSGDEVPLNRRGDLTFNTDFTTNELVIKLERNTDFRWIFVDEVNFSVQQ